MGPLGLGLGGSLLVGLLLINFHPPTDRATYLVDGVLWVWVGGGRILGSKKSFLGLFQICSKVLQES